MLKIDSHTHPFQRDRSNRNGMIAFAEKALNMGFDGIIFTEHAPLKVYDSEHWLSEAELEQYLIFAEECKQLYRGKLQITIGLECDYIPENLDYLTGLLAKYKVEYVGGSIHLHAPFWQDKTRSLGVEERVRYALSLTLDAVNSGIFDTINHLDFFRWKQASYAPELYEDLFRNIFESMVEHDVALEWNSSGLQKDFASALPCRKVWDWSRQYPLRRVFGSDAHAAKFVGFGYDGFVAAIEALTADCPEV